MFSKFLWHLLGTELGARRHPSSSDLLIRAYLGLEERRECAQASRDAQGYEQTSEDVGQYYDDIRHRRVGQCGGLSSNEYGNREPGDEPTQAHKCPNVATFTGNLGTRSGIQVGESDPFDREHDDARNHPE